MASPIRGGVRGVARRNRPTLRRSRLAARPLLTEPLEERRLLTATPELLADIGFGDASEPASFTEMNGEVYFSAVRGDVGRELFKTDGTPEGTQLVKDISPSVDELGSRPGLFTNVAGTLFFAADNGSNGAELWKTDGTAEGTVLVKDIRLGATGSSPNQLVNVAGTLYFVADDGISGRELWKSDGSEAGTVLVKDINPSSGAEDPPSRLTALGGTLIFSAVTSGSGRELWKSDGSDAGTVLLKEISPGPASSYPTQFSEVNGELFFLAGLEGTELWKTDGTTAGTVPVKLDFSAYDGPYAISPSSLVNVSGTLFFAASDGLSGKELWKSDGTTAGTVLVADIRPGFSYADPYETVPYGSGPFQLTNVSGTLFFTASGEDYNTELWKSDGTAAGTQLVKDIYTGFSNPAPTALTNVGGTLYFAGTTVESGTELWRSDGTAVGTYLVADINPGAGSAVSLISQAGGNILVRATDMVHGIELWFSDGTSEGTQLVDINPFTRTGSSPKRFVDLNGTTFFEVITPTRGLELWTTDGSAGGTEFFMDVRSGSGSTESSALTRVGDTLFFRHDGGSGYELWKTDGTLAGTSLVKDTYPAGHGSPQNLLNWNGTLFFTARDGLWKSDGTEAGTVRLKSFPLANSGQVTQLVVVGDQLFLGVNDGTHGIELWKSDGTEAGTTLVTDIRAGLLGSGVGDMVNLGGVLLFRADDGVNGSELWKSDGTPAGTALLKDILPGLSGSKPKSSTPQELTVIGNIAYFTASIGTVGRELWKTDGTPAGTVRVKDLYEGTITSEGPSELVAVGSALYFTMFKAASGNELWKSDGTESGTGIVRDIFPGSGSSHPDHLTNVDGKLYFVANDGVSGTELWMSDGTPEGTLLISDVQPGAMGSSPQTLTNVGGALYFGADSGLIGVEPWVLAAPVAATVVDRHIFYNNSKFDGESAAAEGADDGATATDKVAYLPDSGLATTASVSSYVHGINGVMIDIANLDGQLTADDFTFRMGTVNSPESWALAPAPLEIVVRAGEGLGGADRVTITWADGAIKNTWLQVVVEGNDVTGGFNTNTGLAASDVFYFGSRVGDTFEGATSMATTTSAGDELAARFNLGINRPVTSIYDFNRDGVVNAADQLIARNNAGLLQMLDIEPLVDEESAESQVAIPMAEPMTLPLAPATTGGRAALAFAIASESFDDDAADELIAGWWRPTRR